MRRRPARARRVALALVTVISLVTVVRASAASPSPAAPASPSPAAPPSVMVSCNGRSFPVAMLSAPGGAELAADAPARRLAAYLATAIWEGPPPSRWIRAVDEPDAVQFIAWARDASPDAPLWAITVAPGEAEGPAVDGWDVWAAGRCWPEVELPPGQGHAEWVPAGAVAADDTTFVALVTESACNSGQTAAGRVAEPVVVMTEATVALTFGVVPRPGDQTCPSNPPTPVRVTLPEPLGRRALVDGGVVPPRVVQAPPPAPLGSPSAATGLRLEVAPLEVRLAIGGAITDSFEEGVRLRRVRVVDTLGLAITLTASTAAALPGPLHLCLVGPDAAPDDAGLSDRCWGDPDLTTLVGAAIAEDAEGRPVIPVDRPLRLEVTVQRGDRRCDYPAGRWQLEVWSAPGDGGEPVPVASPWPTLEIPWQGVAISGELTRSESRFCGLANTVVAEQGEPPPAEAAPARG